MIVSLCLTFPAHFTFNISWLLFKNPVIFSSPFSLFVCFFLSFWRDPYKIHTCITFSRKFNSSLLVLKNLITWVSLISHSATCFQARWSSIRYGNPSFLVKNLKLNFTLNLLLSFNLFSSFLILNLILIAWVRESESSRSNHGSTKSRPNSNMDQL